MTFTNIRYISSGTDKAKYVAKILEEKYKIPEFNNIIDSNSSIDLIIALGGDGLLLKTINEAMNIRDDEKLVFYGINCGNIGFLMNKFIEAENLIEKFKHGHIFELGLLKIKAKHLDGTSSSLYAANEISLNRKTQRASSLKIYLNDILVLNKLAGDGVIIATPVGSNAYSLSAGGVVLPLDSKLLILTPINTFFPRRMSSVLLSEEYKIKITVDNAERRQVIGCADYQEIANIEEIEVMKDKERHINLLFDSKKILQDKILLNQFS